MIVTSLCGSTTAFWHGSAKQRCRLNKEWKSPMNVERLILFDLDKTLINENYKYTPNDNPHIIKQAIQKKVQVGWLVGLNSDTPVRRLQTRWEELGMNGPIIAENGAVIWLPDEGEVFVSKARDLFAKLREEVIAALARLEDCCVFIGDGLMFAEKATGIAGGKAVAAVDRYRQCGLGVFIRKVVNGRPEKDSKTAECVARHIYRLIPNHPLIPPPDPNSISKYCFFHVNARDVNKAIGLEEVRKRLPHLGRMVMVGDSMSDFMDVPGVEHWAVGNADPTFKEKASGIAQAEYTEGCIEILQNL
jgi:hydroxymethylpyrimidine pyrophosphatase-like HAD family hydrolase